MILCTTIFRASHAVVVNMVWGNNDGGYCVFFKSIVKMIRVFLEHVGFRRMGVCVCKYGKHFVC